MEKPKMDKVTEKGVEGLEKTISNLKEMSVEKILQDAPAPRYEDPLTLMSKRDFDDYDAPFIKPSRSFAPTSKPHPKEEKARKEGWEYIKGIAENLECIGEKICFWRNEFLGDPAFYWEIPVGIPIWIPRHIARYLSTRNYHRFKMADKSGVDFLTGRSQGDEQLVVKETMRRLDFRVGF